MNEIDQNIAIATWLGWTHIEDCSEPIMMPPGTTIRGYPPTGAIIGKKVELPNYTLDLNAMHEAERRFTFEQQEHYERHLSAILINSVPEDQCPPPSYHATAAQRAEALLRTLNLWKE